MFRRIAQAIVLVVEAGRTSETSVNFYESTRRNIPEDGHLHTSRRENLKSHIIILLRARMYEFRISTWTNLDFMISPFQIWKSMTKYVTTLFLLYSFIVTDR
jgi:hypothetical protein